MLNNPVITGSARNYLLNPSGEINQRSAGSQADVTYDFDQWLTLTQSNAITASQLTDVEDTTPFMMRSLQANASAQRFGRIQWLEKAFCRDLRGQPVTLSARVRMSASTTLRYAVVEWTGTADSPTKDVVNDWTSPTFTAGNFFTSTTTTIVGTGSIALTANTLTDVAAYLGVVSSSMNNLAVFFWTDSTQAQNVTLDIGKAKQEKGSGATPFVARRISDERRDCFRYYVTRAYANYQLVKNLTSAAQNGGIIVFLPEPMAKSPAVTTADAAAASGKITMWNGNGITPTIVVTDNQIVAVNATDSGAATVLQLNFSLIADATM